METSFFRLQDDWYLKAQAELSHRELRVILYIAMSVNGYYQEPVNLSHSIIGKRIKLARPHVTKSIKLLIEKEWIKSSQKGYSLKSGILRRKGTDSVPIENEIGILSSNGTESVHCENSILSSNSTNSVHNEHKTTILSSNGTESVQLGILQDGDRYQIGTCEGTESVHALPYNIDFKNNLNKKNINSNELIEKKEKSKTKIDNSLVDDDYLDRLNPLTDEERSGLKEFCRTRQKIKKPLTKNCLKRLLQTLDRLAGADTDYSAAIIWQSVNCEYAGFFPIKWWGEQRGKV